MVKVNYLKTFNNIVDNYQIMVYNIGEGVMNMGLTGTNVVLTAKDKVTMYNMFEEELVLYTGDTLSGIKGDVNGLSVIAIDLLGVKTIYFTKDVEKIFDVKLAN